MTLAKPPSPAGDVAGVTFAPTIGRPLGRRSPCPRLPREQTLTPTPAPVAFTPFTDRLAGTWLLRQHLGEDARHAGVYLRELILEIQPACDEGPCSVTARLVDPRTDEDALNQARDAGAGYPLSALTRNTATCAPAMGGRTSRGGRHRGRPPSRFECSCDPTPPRPFFPWMVPVASGRTSEDARSAAQETAYEFEVTAEKLTEESRAGVTGI